MKSPAIHGAWVLPRSRSQTRTPAAQLDRRHLTAVAGDVDALAVDHRIAVDVVDLGERFGAARPLDGVAPERPAVVEAAARTPRPRNRAPPPRRRRPPGSGRRAGRCPRRSRHGASSGGRSGRRARRAGCRPRPRSAVRRRPSARRAAAGRATGARPRCRWLAFRPRTSPELDGREQPAAVVGEAAAEQAVLDRGRRARPATPAGRSSASNALIRPSASIV